MLPCAISLWSGARSYCLLNGSAKRLINYSEADFLNRPSLWPDRIHPDDQQKFLQSQERLAKGKSPVHCDYRFFPKNADRPLWIREISALCRGQNKTAWDILSVYTDISDLKATKAAEDKENPLADAVKLLTHEFQNCVHKIKMELDLAGLGLKGKFNYTNLVSTVDSMNRLLEDLRPQLVRVVGMEGRRTSQNPSAILDTIVRKMRKDLNRQRVNLNLVRRGRLPMVHGDNEELHSAFERVFEFCGAMLKDGGNLEVEAGPKELGGQVYAEVKLTTRSPAFIKSGREKVFQSDVGIEGDRNKLSIDLAREIFSRYRGQVSFRKQSSHRGQVTILIKASSK
ncbi:MAG TPA: PAS domain-containing protein [Candidatus Binatia bacterium]|nr:PAS domain-containing protein [Candidatus Binatia bacterium]